MYMRVCKEIEEIERERERERERKNAQTAASFCFSSFSLSLMCRTNMYMCSLHSLLFLFLFFLITFFLICPRLTTQEAVFVAGGTTLIRTQAHSQKKKKKTS